MTGIDAYENAWDIVSKQLWSVLGFNAVWLAGSFLALLVLFLFAVVACGSWAAFFVLSAVVLLEVAPLWEGANIVRYGSVAGRVPESERLPVRTIIVARLLFLVIVSIGYLACVLPGIYLHSRFSLYLPVLIHNPSLSPTQSLSRSWLLTRGRFVALYTLWIAIVVSKPVCLLPLGLGFLIERPVCGLAKDIMMCSCGDRPRGGPA